MTLSVFTDAFLETRYYEKDQDRVTEQLFQDLPFPKVLASIIKDYFINIANLFDAQSWRNCYGIDAGKEPLLFSEEFHKFWFGADPIDKTKRVYETHLAPVLLPHTINSIPFSLKALEKHALDPSVGCFVAECRSFYSPKHILEGLEKSESTEPSCWLVMRNEVFGRGLSYQKQTQLIERINHETNLNYEKEPSLTQIVTVLLTRHTTTSERHFGNKDGVEGQKTYSGCREINELNGNHFVVGAFQNIQEGEGSIHRLMIGAVPKDTYAPSFFGIAAVKIIS